MRLIARDPMRDFGPNIERDAAYLATVNKSSGSWSYTLQTLPRVSGKSTRVVITEYQLPRKIALRPAGGRRRQKRQYSGRSRSSSVGSRNTWVLTPRASIQVRRKSTTSRLPTPSTPETRMTQE